MKKQNQLSFLIDKAVFDADYAAACPADKATLLSECQVGAREFWDATPHSSLGTVLKPSVFIEEVRTRLRVSDGEDRWCPLCDVVMDSQGVHSRCCSAGGDRTLRHNALRNAVFRLAKEAGANPELEKPSLLLPERPGDLVSQRRPADIRGDEPRKIVGLMSIPDLTAHGGTNGVRSSGSRPPNTFWEARV